MGDQEPHDSKEEIEEELTAEDVQVGDDQSSNPQRDNFTTLHGED